MPSGRVGVSADAGKPRGARAAPAVPGAQSAISGGVDGGAQRIGGAWGDRSIAPRSQSHPPVELPALALCRTALGRSRTSRDISRTPPTALGRSTSLDISRTLPRSSRASLDISCTLPYSTLISRTSLVPSRTLPHSARAPAAQLPASSGQLRRRLCPATSPAGLRVFGGNMSGPTAASTV